MNLTTSSRLLILFCVSVFIQSCNDGLKDKKKDEYDGTITISGAFALYPLVVKWGHEFEKLHPRVKVDVSADGAGKGMADALSDNVNLGMVSREVKPEEIEKGAWGITVAKDAVLPTVNSSNADLKEILAHGLSKEQFEAIWISGKLKTWGEAIGTDSKEPIHVYTRSDASGAGETWAKFLDKKQEDLIGVGVFGDPGLAAAVKKDKYGIGFNNIAYIYDLKSQKPYDGLVVIPIDLNSNGKIDSTEKFYDTHDKVIEAIANGTYPSPPARDLYFISNGPPKDKLVIEFFKWILTDGQKYVHETGYLRLSENKVKAEVEILDTY
jgi:phosphate transport system substrate-binding protein